MCALKFLTRRAMLVYRSAAALIAIIASSSHAATIIVTDNSTFVGANVGCSLARAVSYINAGAPTDAFNYCTNSGDDYGVLDTIEFSLGGGTPAITVTNNSVTYIEIPTIQKPVLINGATGGANRIEIVPSSGVISPALRVSASGVELANLVIHGFPLAQIDFEKADHDDVIGSYIGTDATGLKAMGTNSWGIRVINSDKVTVGTIFPNDRNVIAANIYGGLQIAGGSSNINVFNNVIGVGSDGITSMGNCGDGRDSSCAGIVIGPRANHVAIHAGNVIGGNYGDGIRIAGTGGFMPGDDPTDVTVAGNFVGVAADGSTPLPNAGAAGSQSCGIKMAMSTTDVVANTIGGAYSGAGNVIAYNGYCGIGVSGGGVAAGEPTNLLDIESNTFFGNGQLAIDLSSTLAGDGATANDADGHANGPNLFQNYPVLSGVPLNTGGKLYVSGALASAMTPNQDLRIEVFSNPAGQSQGKHWRGCILLRTNTSGNAAFADKGPFTLAPGDADITLTGTTDFGTSEMSASMASVASNDIIFANGFDTVAAPGVCN